MMTLYDLYRIADDNQIDVDYFPLSSLTSVATPDSIAMDVDKLESLQEEKAVLGHELGHCMTGSFYRADSGLETRGRMEARANRWAYEKLLPWEDLKEAISSGITEPWALSEHFELPQWFLTRALDYYLNTCGLTL